MFGAGYRTPAKAPETVKSPDGMNKNMTTPERRSPTTLADPRVHSKPKQKALSQDSAKPIRKITIEAEEGPSETPKYSSKTAEAKACLVKAKLHLGNSRNLKTDIKAEVTQVIERLYILVKEVEAELEKGRKQSSTISPPQKKGSQTTGVKRSQTEPGVREDVLMTKIEEQTKLLTENSRKIDELKGLIESKKETLKEDTYASVTSKSSNRERVALHSIIVSSEKEEETGEEILEKIRKAVDAKEGWVTVEKVRKAKDRKIVMGCKTQDERRKIKERLETAQQQLVVEEVKNKDPLVVLRDVLTVHSDDDILQALRKQNRSVFYGLDTAEDRMIVKYRKRARNPLNGHIILSVSPQIWNRLLEVKKVRIDLQHIQVEDQSPLVQCTRCLGYGHSRKFCKESADLCSHCGGLHLSVECPEKLSGVPPECKNCTRAKFDHCAHNAFSNECPVRRKWDRLARASVAYC